MHRLVKLGRMRLSLSPNPFAKGNPYHQVLKLRDGCCEISAGKPRQGVKLRVFVDARSQTVYVSGTSDRPLAATFSLENWRQEKNDLRTQGTLGSTWIYRNELPKEQPSWESADQILSEPTALTWLHHNEHSPVDLHVKQQHMEAAAALVQDPIKDRIFGASVSGAGFSVKDGQLQAQGLRRFDLRLVTHSALYPGAGAKEDFRRDLRQKSDQTQAADLALQGHAAWWQAYWKRSWIFVSQNANSLESPVAANKHSLRFGAASDGSNASQLEFSRYSVIGRGLDAPEIETIAKGLTLEAWVKADSWSGRIFDKITPGGTDGFLFDAYGSKLRFIVGGKLLVASEDLPTQAGCRTRTGGVRRA
jgi:hypothetical protein